MIYTTPSDLAIFIKQRIIAERTSLSSVADTLNKSTQSLSQTLNRGSLKVSMLNDICNALGYDLEINFVKKQNQD